MNTIKKLTIKIISSLFENNTTKEITEAIAIIELETAINKMLCED